MANQKNRLQKIIASNEEHAFYSYPFQNRVWISPLAKNIS